MQGGHPQGPYLTNGTNSIDGRLVLLYVESFYGTHCINMYYYLHKKEIKTISILNKNDRRFWVSYGA